jgi:hypothetical protein
MATVASTCHRCICRARRLRFYISNAPAVSIKSLHPFKANGFAAFSRFSYHITSVMDSVYSSQKEPRFSLSSRHFRGGARFGMYHRSYCALGLSSWVLSAREVKRLRQARLMGRFQMILAQGTDAACYEVMLGRGTPLGQRQNAA